MKSGAWDSSLDGDIDKSDPAELQYLATVIAQAEVAGGLATRRSIKQYYYSSSVSKAAETFSNPVDVFLVAGDRVTISKLSIEAAPILKSCNVIVVPACGVTMLTYQIQKQYNEQVTLAMMLKDSGFKEAYNKSK